MNESKLRELIKQFIEEYLNTVEDDELGEITVTGNIDGYSTPKAFKKTNGKKKKKAGFTKAHRKPDVFGYSVVKEALDKSDIEIIRKLIRDVISDVYRDIWIKRNTWK